MRSLGGSGAARPGTTPACSDTRLHAWKDTAPQTYTPNPVGRLRELFAPLGNGTVSGRALVAQSCPTLCDPVDAACQLLCPWDSPGKNTEVGGLSLLQGLFRTQALNPGLLRCRRILYQLGPREAPRPVSAAPTNCWEGSIRRRRSSEKPGAVSSRARDALASAHAVPVTWVPRLPRLRAKPADRGAQCSLQGGPGGLGQDSPPPPAACLEPKRHLKNKTFNPALFRQRPPRGSWLPGSP